MRGVYVGYDIVMSVSGAQEAEVGVRLLGQRWEVVSSDRCVRHSGTKAGRKKENR